MDPKAQGSSGTSESEKRRTSYADTSGSTSGQGGDKVDGLENEKKVDQGQRDEANNRTEEAQEGRRKDASGEDSTKEPR